MLADVFALSFGDFSSLACVCRNRFTAFPATAHPHDGLFNRAAGHELDDREAEECDADERQYFKYSTALLIGMIVMLAVSVPAAIYFSYDQGMNWRDGFATSTIPRESINSMLKARNNLLAQGNLELSESVKGFDRFTIMKPNQNFLIAFASTFIGVILFSVCRLHITTSQRPMANIHQNHRR